MKSLTGIVLLAAWLLIGINSPGTADTTKSHFKVKADTAVADFEAFDPDNACIENFVSVVASDGMEKVSPGGGPTSTVRTVLIVGQIDGCLGVTLFSGQGETPEQSFQFSLSSATLSTTVPVFDSISRQMYDFDVDLTWTATGAPVSHHDQETFRDKDLGIKIQTQLRGRHVPAVATGTVVGLGHNFTPKPSDSAELQTDNNGTITIEKTK
jgi:hypothetical protein